MAFPSIAQIAIGDDNTSLQFPHNIWRVRELKINIARGYSSAHYSPYVQTIQQNAPCDAYQRLVR